MIRILRCLRSLRCCSEPQDVEKTVLDAGHLAIRTLNNQQCSKKWVLWESVFAFCSPTMFDLGSSAIVKVLGQSLLSSGILCCVRSSRNRFLGGFPQLLFSTFVQFPGVF